MTEIVKINVENEMDLILCHKRSMKLAELCSLSVLAQTSFATAVSEISRCVIGSDDNKSILSLGIHDLRNNRKELMAVLTTNIEFGKKHDESIKYATRLAQTLTVSKHKKETVVVITAHINFSGLINEIRLQAFVNYFKKELPLSPYDEIRKKNIQLLEIAEKLQESEDQYRKLTETLPLMVFTTNIAGNLTFGNKWLIDYFSFSEIHPGKLIWHKLLEPADYKTIFPLWEKTQANPSSFKAQAKLKNKKTGELLWHIISIIPLISEENKLTGWTGFFVDIHAQKLIEETLKNNVDLKAAQTLLLNYQAKLENNLKELNKSNHDLEQFAYIASHDLQEPLRKIRNFTELLGSNINDAEKAQKYLDKIDVSSTRMSGLIQDVLNYSRLSKSGVHFEETNLEQILNNVKTDVELIIEEKEAIINSPVLPIITGIPQQIHQLFYNLINNALKFNSGKPIISISCNRLDQAQVKEYPDLHASVEYIELRIKDNGIGFDQKYANNIFTIFKRLNSKESFEGSGIGLALCKKIVDNHHGHIAAESEVGKGTTFKVILPVA